MKMHILPVFIFGVISFSNAFADTWSTVNIVSIESLPNGNFDIRSDSAQAGGCGIDPKPFQVVESLHYVTSNGVKGMLATTLASIALGKKITIHYYENEGMCPVDAITLTL